MWPAKNAVLAPPGFSPGMVIPHNFRAITEQNRDATNFFHYFVAMRPGVEHQCITFFFYLLALRLGSSEGVQLKKAVTRVTGTEAQGGEKGKSTEIAVKRL